MESILKLLRQASESLQAAMNECRVQLVQEDANVLMIMVALAASTTARGACDSAILSMRTIGDFYGAKRE